MARPVATSLAALPPHAALAVGTFDGVHCGHRALIGQMLAFAEAHQRPPCILTFTNSPLSYLDPANAPGAIYDEPRLLGQLQSLLPEPEGQLIALTFDAELAALSADAFAEALRSATIFCGEDWRFGRGAAGTPGYLAELGFEVRRVPYARSAGERISSTRLRAAMEQGAMDAVAAMLGTPWAFTGTVVYGRGLAGKTFGVPTLNIPYVGAGGTKMAPLARGVYTARAELSLRDGTLVTSRALVNFGVAPSIKGEPEPLFEAHLLDATGDFYGATATLVFETPRRRAEQKFPTLEALKAQIQADLAACRGE